MNEALERNVAAYGAQLQGLLAEHEGQYVLIADGEVHGICARCEEALELGYRKFQRDPFFVHKNAPLESEPVDFHLECRA